MVFDLQYAMFMYMFSSHKSHNKTRTKNLAFTEVAEQQNQLAYFLVMYVFTCLNLSIVVYFNYHYQLLGSLSFFVQVYRRLIVV